MSLLNNLKDFFIPTEVEEDNDIKQTTSEPEKNDSTYSSSTSSVTNTTRSNNYTGQHEERKSSYSSAPKTAPAVSVSRPSFSSSPTLQVILVKPTEYTDAKKIADHLMNGRTVVLVLEEATEQTRRRIIDFLIGVAYAMNGNLKPIANQTYIVTPHDVGLVDQLVSELGKSYSASSESAPTTII